MMWLESVFAAAAVLIADQISKALVISRTVTSMRERPFVSNPTRNESTWDNRVIRRKDNTFSAMGGIYHGCCASASLWNTDHRHARPGRHRRCYRRGNGKSF
jgi:hypothetical protein